MIEGAFGPSQRSVGRGRAMASLLLHAFVIWVACAATIGIGQALTTMQTTLIVHAVAAPVFATVVSVRYFRRHARASPLVTASVVLAFIMAVDFFLVALVLNRSLDMFRSVLGTWLPFALIFAATAGTGWITRRRPVGARGSASGRAGDTPGRAAPSP